MEKRLYHGSATPGISALEPRSRLHSTELQVVYLTDCAPYALLYIWDAGKHCGADKHVTAWVEKGIAHYEEQFPDQLQVFYHIPRTARTGVPDASKSSRPPESYTAFLRHV